MILLQFVRCNIPYIFFITLPVGLLSLSGCDSPFSPHDHVSNWWYDQEPDDFHLGDPTGGGSRVGGRGGASSGGLGGRSSNTNH